MAWRFKTQYCQLVCGYLGGHNRSGVICHVVFALSSPPHSKCPQRLSHPHRWPKMTVQTSFISSEGIVHAASNPVVPAIVTILLDPPCAVPDIFAAGQPAVVSRISAVLEPF